MTQQHSQSVEERTTLCKHFFITLMLLIKTGYVGRLQTVALLEANRVL